MPSAIYYRLLIYTHPNANIYLNGSLVVANGDGYYATDYNRTTDDISCVLTASLSGNYMFCRWEVTYTTTPIIGSPQTKKTALAHLSAPYTYNAFIPKAASGVFSSSGFGSNDTYRDVKINLVLSAPEVFGGDIFNNNAQSGLCKVTFNPNGGTGGRVQYVSGGSGGGGTTIYLPSDKFYRNGVQNTLVSREHMGSFTYRYDEMEASLDSDYIFLGWSTSMAQDFTISLNGSCTTEDIRTYLNGYTSYIDGQKKTYNLSSSLNVTTSLLQPGQQVTINKSVTYYAVWLKNFRSGYNQYKKEIVITSDTGTTTPISLSYSGLIGDLSSTPTEVSKNDVLSDDPRVNFTSEINGEYTYRGYAFWMNTVKQRVTSDTGGASLVDAPVNAVNWTSHVKTFTPSGSGYAEGDQTFQYLGGNGTNFPSEMSWTSGLNLLVRYYAEWTGILYYEEKYAYFVGGYNLGNKAFPVGTSIIVLPIYKGGGSGEDEFAETIIVRVIPAIAQNLYTLKIGAGPDANTWPSGWPNTTEPGLGRYLGYSAPPFTSVLLPTMTFNTNKEMAAWKGTEGGDVYKPCGTFAVVPGNTNVNIAISDHWAAYYRGETFLIAFNYNAADPTYLGSHKTAYLTSEGDSIKLNSTATCVRLDTSTNTLKTYQLLGWQMITATAGNSDPNNRTKYNTGVIFGPDFTFKPSVEATGTDIEMLAVWVLKDTYDNSSPLFKFTFDDPFEIITYPYNVKVNFSYPKVALPIYDCEPTGYRTIGWAPTQDGQSGIVQGSANAKWFEFTSNSAKNWTQYFELITYSITIIFDGNGGTNQGNAFYNNVILDRNGELTDTNSFVLGGNDGYADPTRPNYNFMGWNNASNDTSANFQTGVRYRFTSITPFAIKTGDTSYEVHLYAVWMPQESGLTLMYNSNCNDGTSTIQGEYVPMASSGSWTYTITNASPTRADKNWVFFGWCDGTLLFNNIVVTFALQSTPDYQNYPYKATFEHADIPVDSEINLVLTSSQSDSGRYFCPEIVSTTGKVSIYANTNVGTQQFTSLWIYFPGSGGASTPQYVGNDTVTLSKDMPGMSVTKILYACWFRYERRLEYDINGGIGQPPAEITYTNIEKNAQYLVTSIIPTKMGSIFNGWVNSSHTYTAGSLISVPSTMTMFGSDTQFDQIYSTDGGTTWSTTPVSTTLTAQWVGRTAQVVYDANGGTKAPAAQSSTSDVDDYAIFTIPSEIPTRPSHKFIGWNSNGTLTEDPIYDTSTTPACFEPATVRVAYGSILTLYAIWEHVYTSAGSADGTEIDQYGQLANFVPDDNITTHTVYTGTEYNNMIFLSFDDITTAPRLNSYTTYTYDENKYPTIDPIELPWLYIEQQTIVMIDDENYTVTYGNVHTTSKVGTYIIRFTGTDDNNTDVEYYVKLIVLEGSDERRIEPECYLEKQTKSSNGLIKSRFTLKHVTSITKSYKVSLNNTYIMTKPVRTRYIMDLGNVETYNVTIVRANPSDYNDNSTDPALYSNPKWVEEFQKFTDVWQNSTYNPDYSLTKKTGGFKFVYSPPDTTRFPEINKNVFIQGSISVKYLPDQLTMSIPLLVSSMIPKDGQDVSKDGLYINYHTLNPSNGYSHNELWAQSAIYSGLPVIISRLPYFSNVDCAFWRGVINDVVQEDLFSPLQTVEWENIAKYATGADNTRTYLYPLRIISKAYAIITPSQLTIVQPEGTSTITSISSSVDESSDSERQGSRSGAIRLNHQGMISVDIVGGGGGAGGDYIIASWDDNDGGIGGAGAIGGGGGSGGAKSKSFTTTTTDPIIINYSVGKGGEGGGHGTYPFGAHSGQDGQYTSISSDEILLGSMKAAGGDKGTAPHLNASGISGPVGRVIDTATLIFRMTPGTGGKDVNSGGDGIKHNSTDNWHDFRCGEAICTKYRDVVLGTAGSSSPFGAGGGAAPFEVKIDYEDPNNNISRHLSYSSHGGDGRNQRGTNRGSQNGTYGGGGGSAVIWKSGDGGDGIIIIKCMGLED